MANQNNIEWAMQVELEEELQQQQQNHALFSQAAAAAAAPPACGEASYTLDDFINDINVESLDQFLTSIEEEINQLHEINEGLHPPPPPNFSTTTPASAVAAAGQAKSPVFFEQETVDQVWDEIMKCDLQQNHQEQQQITNFHIPPPQTQETNGWMSLEEYLIEAGVSVPRELSHPFTPPQTFAPLQSFPSNKSIEIEEFDLAISNPEIPPSTSLVHHDLNTYTNQQQQLDINVPMEGTTLVVVDGDNREEEMDMGGGRRDGYVASHRSDKMKRRMIKNRETAARSRARKQAEIAQLEENIAQLKAENTRLEQDLAEIKKKRAQARSGGKVRKLLRSSSS